ncbi:MAG: hypothetical protein EOM67_12450 [Spirochaetia bacterium]|nr:hypothetical protein [Spirochaetia bacterium]
MDYQNKYIDLILGVSLSLQQGEALSINTSERNLEFAQIVAQKASEITLIPVSIVLIEEGIVKDVFSVTPIENELISEESLYKVLLRIEDPFLIEEFPKVPMKEIASSTVLLQAVRNLGPPQLTKVVAPWAVAPVPSLFWAKSLFQTENPVDDMWALFARLLFLDEPNFPFSYTEHLKKLNSMTKRMIQSNKKYLHIKDDKTDLYVKLVHNSYPRHKLTLLEGTRVFMPTLFNHGISMIVETTYTHGKLFSSRPFLLLGELVEEAQLVFEGGKVVSFEAKRGKKALEVALQIDEGALRIGLMSLVEEKSVIAHLPTFGSTPIDESVTSFITLGMGESNHLRELDTYGDEQELSAKTGLNTSVLKGRIPFGNNFLAVDMYDDEGDIPIMVNGNFIQ